MSAKISNDIVPFDGNSSGIPEGMIKEKFGNPQYINGKTVYFEPVTRKKMTREEVEQVIQKELDQLKPF